MSDVATDSGAFRQQVRMAAVQVAGLRPDELAQALAYEVEPLSGIPATEAEVTYQPIVDADPTVRVFDVTVRRRTRRSGTAGGLDRWLLPAFVCAALVILGAAGDAAWIFLRRSALEKTVNERRPLQAQLAHLESETRAAAASAAQIHARREAEARAQGEAAAFRRAHAEILAALTRACGRGTVLRSIAAGEDAQTMRVSAMDVSGEAAAGMLQSLAVQVSANGWQVLPGEMNGSGTGATVSFSFDVTRAR